MSVISSRSTVISKTGGGGGISASAAYSDPIDCSRAVAVKARIDYTKSGINLTVGFVDASDSSDATIAATYDPILSTRQSTGIAATTHTISATGRAVIVCNLGGLCGKVRLVWTGSGGGAAGDAMIAEVTVSEEG